MSWCSALNVKVINILSGSFLPLLFVRYNDSPWFPISLPLWLVPSTPEKYSLLSLLKRFALLDSLIRQASLVVLIGPGLIWWTVRPKYTLSRSLWWFILFGLPPSTICMYNFYLNKLFNLFIFLKEISMIIKTYIKLILNMNNLFSKFYCREKETTCNEELKNTIPKCVNPK